MPTKYPQELKTRALRLLADHLENNPTQASTPPAETSENASASALKPYKNGTNKPKSMLVTPPAPPLIWQPKTDACAKKTPSSSEPTRFYEQHQLFSRQNSTVQPDHDPLYR